MANFSKECIETFLNKQLQLFDEKVAETPQEAEEFPYKKSFMYEN